jgi:plasmid maintenance system antidote protein VapI
MMEHRTSIKPYILHGIKEELLEQLAIRKWSKQDLAHFAGLSMDEIENLFGEYPKTSIQILKQISQIFGKTPDHWIHTIE